MPDTLLKISRNTGILLLVNLAGAAGGFLMGAALGRGLGDAGFGRYSFVLTWLLGLMLVTEFGISTVLTRDLAAYPTRSAAYLINSLVGKGVLAVPVCLAVLGFAPYLAPGGNSEVAAALRWGVLYLLSSLAYSSFTAAFRGYQMMTPILWLTVAGQTLLLAGTVVLLLTGHPLWTLIAWAGIGQGIQSGLAWRAYQRRYPTHSLKWNDVTVETVARLLRRAWPFAVAGMLAALQYRANGLLLGYLGGDQALGWYAAANRFAEAGRQFPAAFFGAVLPALAALAGDATVSTGYDALLGSFRQARLAILGYSILVAASTLLLAEPVMMLVYGPVYRPAGTTLQLLALSLIPAGQNSLLILYLYARHDERFVNLLMGVGIIMNLGLGYWLIPRWGAVGTAFALLLSECVVYLPYRERARRIT